VLRPIRATPCFINSLVYVRFLFFSIQLTSAFTGLTIVNSRLSTYQFDVTERSIRKKRTVAKFLENVVRNDNCVCKLFAHNALCSLNKIFLLYGADISSPCNLKNYISDMFFE